MADDRTPPPGTPEEPLLEISSEDLPAATPLPPLPAAPVPPPVPVEPELPVTPADPHHDDQEVTLVQEPTPPAGPLAPPSAPPPPAEAAPAPRPAEGVIFFGPPGPPLGGYPPGSPAEVTPEPPAPPLVVEPEPAVEVPPAPVAYQPPPPPAPAPDPPPAPVEAPPVPPAAYAPVEPPPAPVMASDEWYTGSGGQVYGPYHAADIRAWLQSGQMSWDTPASRGEGDPWRPLSAISEFNPMPAYGAPVGATLAPGQKDKTIAGILGILLGWVGAHHWYLGNYTLAAIYLGVTVLSVGFLSWATAIAGIIEGIMYLTAPEDRFQRNYKKWFLNGP